MSVSLVLAFVCVLSIFGIFYIFRKDNMFCRLEEVEEIIGK